MKFYFWNGSEFNGTAAPCCEIHIMGWRIKILLISRYRLSPQLFYKEKIYS